uniref:Protein kinase domain-containing protein n=1 Tax=Triticum aestivum TaxID=4565 RepID=A0A077RS36_WHEAT|nr:unnamed protein product [Triticum aestivum]
MALASWFLVIAWIWLVPLMHAVAGAEEQQGEGCSSSARSCGNLTISDPFWLTNMDTRRSCGSLDFEVNCFNNTSAILQSSIPGSFGFAIVNISYQERNLHVVDQGKLQALQAPDGCQVPTLNTSAKVGRPFRISPINLNLVLYNCTSEAAAAALSRRGGELVQIRIRCGNQSEVFVRTTGRYNETSSYDSYEGCNTVIMPVLISSGEANTNDYEQLISDGFLLTWAHPLPAPARCVDSLSISHILPFILQLVFPVSSTSPQPLQRQIPKLTHAAMHGWFLMLVWAWCLPLMLAVTAAEEQQGGGCPAKRCGNITISDPFWLTDRETGRSCDWPGPPDFELTCFNSSYPVLQSSVPFSPGFKIISISYGERRLRAVDLGRLELFHASASCLPMWNTSVKLARQFRIDPINLNVIFYNCTEEAAARRDRELVQTTAMRCLNASNSFVRAGVCYDATGNYSRYALEGCDAIIMPMRGSSPGETFTNATDYEQLINDGFLLRWDPPVPLPAPVSARSDRRGKKIMLIGTTSAAATFLFACLYVLIWHRKGKRLWFLLCKKGSSNTEKNYEAMIVSYGSLAPKRYMHSEGSKRALIYEYMPNGSLDKYIYSENPKEILGWERLYAIAIGIARGLEYLHHSCDTRIIHFNIKPQNILLDKDFSPKIADFGLAKLCHTKESKLSMTGTRGTIGFIAPEVHSRTFGVVSTKSYVYSYGMILLEIVGGRRNVRSIVAKSSEKYFPDWIYDHFAQDDGLEACEVTNEIEEIARKMILIGLWCIQVIPLHRPTITKVLEMFERSLDDLDMPPKQNFCELL